MAKHHGKNRYMKLANKAVEICVSAIELYNKPDFKYRAETFCILLTNAWELALKARIIQSANNNNFSFIYERDKDGQIVKNRTGVSKTITIFNALEQCSLDEKMSENIKDIVEIRNTVSHFVTTDLLFEQTVQDVGTASLRNFLTACNDWFGLDLTRYNFFLMPLSFYPQREITSSKYPSKSTERGAFLKHFAEQQQRFPSNESEKFSYALSVKIDFTKSKGEDTLLVAYNSNDPNAIPLSIDRAKALAGLMDYKTLIEACKNRYDNFKLYYQGAWGEHLKYLKDEKNKCMKTEYGDPVRKKQAAAFYNPTNCWKYLDLHYTKK